MKKLSIIIFVASTLLACGVGKDRTRITGQLENYKEGELYLIAPDGWDGLDTIHVTEGKFDFERELQTSTAALLVYPNMTERPIVLEPGKTAKIRGSINRLGKVEVSGSEENELLTEFWTGASGKSKNERAKLASAFIRKHPDRQASVAVWLQTVRQMETTDRSRDAFELMKELQHAQPKNVQMQQAAMRMTGMLQYGVGNKMPAFSFATLTGDSIDDRKLARHPYLFFFWASWRNGSFNELNDLDTQLKERGKKLGIVCYAVDDDVPRCRKSLSYDTLPGHIVCDGLGWGSPFVTQLGVQNIPGNILVDSTGVILGRDLSEKKMKELINKILP